MGFGAAGPQSRSSGLLPIIAHVSVATSIRDIPLIFWMTF